MFKGRIADINVLFEERYNLYEHYIPEFSAVFEKPDVVVSVFEDDIEAERKVSEKRNCPPGQYQMDRAFRKFADSLPDFEAILFHSVFVSVGDKGIAFTARSGTGKSTHMLLWKQLLGDKMTIINGDKPIVRFIDDGLYGYGTPWNGKEHLYTMGRAPLTDICVIERSKTNEVVPMSLTEGAMELMQQIHTPEDPVQLVKTMQLADRVAKQCRFWKIRCNMDIEAAEVAYKAICC